MQFSAHAKFVRFSPYKLRPLVDVIRGKNAQLAINWLATQPIQRIKPIEKVLKSAVSNAYHLEKHKAENLVIKEIRVDQGPTFKYYKPSAMGRSQVLRKRFSHVSVTLETNNKEV